MNILEMKMEINNKKLVTHNGSFHADDIFATAALSLMLEKKGENFEIIRTRDPGIINGGDYVFDVGGIYNENTNRFDHHQVGGAGKRENGIEFASFGLVWKKFGLELVESQEISNIIDEKLVAPIDAADNGLDLVEYKYNVSPYFLQYFFFSMNPTWNENDLINDEMFFKSVEIAKIILSREIIHAKSFVLAEEKIKEDYKNASDKRIIIFQEDFFYKSILNKFPEPLFVIYPRTDNISWGVRAIREDIKSFKNRKNFPAEWGGLRDEELQKITGLEDVIFCHRALFLAVTKTKEGAIALAQKALLEPSN